MVEDTESPRVFHIWSALSGVSACLGRRVHLPFGLGRIYPNIYVLLSGMAAVRKSTAINIVTKIVRESTGVRFAPENTGGKYQGLIAAMTDTLEDEDSLIEAELKQFTKDALIDMHTLQHTKLDTSQDPRRVYDEADKHCVFVSASEFNTFIGHGNIEFLEFLGKMYDGEAYDYRLKNKKDTMVLDDPLISLIGGTTPTNIAEAFPKAAIGQGFTSRIILVYGASTYRDISWPERPSNTIQAQVAKIFSDIYYNFRGEINFDNAAKEFATSIYKQDLPLKDSRFTYYLARRHTHFLKLSIIFAATRMSQTVELMDVNNAHNLLLSTEKFMPDALGEYGMSPMGAAQQQILDFIVYAKEPVTADLVWHIMRRDVRIHELMEILNTLVRAKKIQQVRTATQNLCYIPYIEKEAQQVLSIMDSMKTNPATERLQ